MVCTTKAPKVGHIRLGHLGILSMMWTHNVGCGVDTKFAEQARQLMALRLVVDFVIILRHPRNLLCSNQEAKCSLLWWHKLHVVSSHRLIRFSKHRSAGWSLLQKRRRSVTRKLGLLWRRGTSDGGVSTLFYGFVGGWI